MLAYFERLVDPYPDAPPAPPPRGFFAFLWACSQRPAQVPARHRRADRRPSARSRRCSSLPGQHRRLARQGAPGAAVDAGEGAPAAARRRARRRASLLVALQSTIKQQALFGNFPMLLRWNFHRLMLGQSMGFYQDEFAGRIATKVMQTALAVRDTWLIVCRAPGLRRDLLRHAAGGARRLRLAPAGAVPRLGRAVHRRRCATSCRAWAASRKSQADARSLMTGRITDAYTNIATVKLFSHARREAAYARARDAGIPGHRARADAAGHRLRDRQPHAVDGRSSPPRAGATLWLWTQGQVGVGAVAAATAMALRLNGISHWVMWEMATLFEHIGTVQDGINTLSRAAHGGRRARREAARRHARRDPLRARELRLRRQGAT